MRFRYLEYFMQAVECKSLNRAARQLDISPQTLCAGVAALEKTLGYKLLDRSPTGVTPTHNGQIVFGDAQQIDGFLQKWKTLAPAQGSPQIRPVRLAASTTLMHWIIPHVIIQVKRLYPYIYFELYESYVEQVFREIVDKRMMGIITCVTPMVASSYRIQLMQNDMEMEEGPEDGAVVIINKAHPFANMPVLTKVQLGSLRVAFNPERDKSFVYRDIIQYFSKTGVIHIPEQENLLRLIAMDPTIAAVLPRSVLKSAGGWAESLVGKDVEDFPMPGPIWLIYPKKRRPEEETVLKNLRDCLFSL